MSISRRRGWFLPALLLVPAAPGSAGAELRRTPVVAAVERVSPAVVNISTEQLVARREDPTSPIDPLFEEFFRNFDEPRLEERYERMSLGSGTIVDPRGHVLTNEHVIARASRIKVVLADGRELEAQVVGTDPDSDLAVLKIRSAEKLPSASLGSSADLIIGETLIAIGNPFGLTHTVTTGVLSAKSRVVRAGERRFGDFLQTDAAINPGNSGGPILNLEGSIVGIATAIHAGGHGIGFAIPVDRARRVLEAILSHGTVQAGWIGAETKPAPEGVRRALGLEGGRGVVVSDVVAGSPAAEAGLAAGDVLVAAAGQPLLSSTDLESVLASRGRGQSTRLDALRGGRRHSFSVKALEPDSPRLLGIAEALLGVNLEVQAPGSTGLRLGTVAPEGRAARRGLKSGDVLYELDGTRLEGLGAFKKAFFRALGRRHGLFLVQHGEAAYYVPLELE